MPWCGSFREYTLDTPCIVYCLGGPLNTLGVLSTLDIFLAIWYDDILKQLVCSMEPDVLGVIAPVKGLYCRGRIVLAYEAPIYDFIDINVSIIRANCKPLSIWRESHHLDQVLSILQYGLLVTASRNTRVGSHRDRSIVESNGNEVAVACDASRALGIDIFEARTTIFPSRRSFLRE